MREKSYDFLPVIKAGTAIHFKFEFYYLTSHFGSISSLLKEPDMDKDDNKKTKRDNNKYVRKSREKKRLGHEKQQEELKDAQQKLKLLKQIDDQLDIEIKMVRRIRDGKLNQAGDVDLSHMTDPIKILEALSVHDANPCPWKI